MKIIIVVFSNSTSALLLAAALYREEFVEKFIVSSFRAFIAGRSAGGFPAFGRHFHGYLLLSFTLRIFNSFSIFFARHLGYCLFNISISEGINKCAVG